MEMSIVASRKIKCKLSFFSDVFGPVIPKARRSYVDNQSSTRNDVSQFCVIVSFAVLQWSYVPSSKIFYHKDSAGIT
jgi:hypothetical protein